MILLIDNYDSFTYNLYQFIGIFNSDIKVVRNDKITIKEIEELDPSAIIVSPGPKSPKEAGICIEAIKYFASKKPILGICLGHQSIGEAFGATVSFAKSIMHGKQSKIDFKSENIFAGLKSPINVARYHSLAILEETMPEELEVIARTDDNEIMAIKHRDYPIYGLQFHPESIYTDYGKKMIENFLEEAKAL
ncbi:anthranilate synthase component II [Lachnospira sp.]|jgi:anthranilate synthase component 2|uniref:anthranilate synthase component II n=1 Tax=Lachnospira sp. TaxID=2049031 RepID=UPI002579E62F|nr:aminodeoxychorismate/anthranilate synthase component II [Lachnospira sp.]